MAKNFGGFQSNRGDSTKVVVAGAVLVVLILLGAAFYLLTVSKNNQAGPVVVQPKVEEEKPQHKMQDVLIALREVQVSEQLDPSMFKRQSRIAISVPERAVTNFEQIQGQYARRTIFRDQPLTLEDLTSVRPVNTLTANIPEGFRAVTISVDVISSVEGFVRPGAKVDVIWISTVRGRPATTTIVENVQVLSAERATEKEVPQGAPVPNTVTLLVSISDAAKIQLASSTGKLRLSLRGDLDNRPGAEGVTVTIDDLLQRTNPGQNKPKYEGVVKIGDQEYVMENGRLRPASRKDKKAQEVLR